MRSVAPMKGSQLPCPSPTRYRSIRNACLAPLISLRMLAQGEAGAPLPRWVVVEVAQATSTVLAEAEAARRAELAAAGSAATIRGMGHSSG